MNTRGEDRLARHLHSFLFQDGKIKQQREFMNPCQQFRALNIPVPQVVREGVPAEPFETDGVNRGLSVNVLVRSAADLVHRTTAMVEKRTALDGECGVCERSNQWASG